jgi:integrase
MASITKRADRPKPWQARYRLPDGRQRSRQFARKVDAERFLRQLEHDQIRGTWVDPALGRVTFAEYAIEWSRSLGHLQPGTRANIAGRLSNHLLPYFGPMPLGAIRPADARAWVAEMIGKGLAAGTINATYRTLGKVLRTAEIDGLIGRSPLVGVDLPREAARAEMVFLSAVEVVALAEAIADRFAALIYTAAYSGLRWGELAGLHEERLELARGVIHVVEALSEVDGHLHLKSTKTGGTRTVSLPPFLVAMLAEHLSRYPSRAGHVFSSAEGFPLRRRNFYRRRFKPAVIAAGLDPRLRFHDLRHTCTALLISQGAHPKEIQERLGHSTIRLTFDRYGHLFPSLDARLRDGLEALYQEAVVHRTCTTDAGVGSGGEGR